MDFFKYLILFLLTVLYSCSHNSAGSTNVRTIRDSITKTTMEIETRMFGTGGGFTGGGPNLIKIKVSKYDSTNNVFYRSYKETAFNGCLGRTKVWEVNLRTSDGSSREMKLIEDTIFKIIYKSRFNKIDSVVTIPYSDVDYIGWIDHIQS